MPNAPSNWMSFADYLGVAGPAAQRTLEQEQQRVNDLGGQTNVALQTAGQQAVAGRGTDLNQTAGYSDFLKAQQAQKTAYQQLQAHASGTGQGSAQENALYGSLGQANPAQTGGGEGAEAGWQARAADRKGFVAQSDQNVAAAQKAASDAQAARDSQYQEALGRMFWDQTGFRGDLTHPDRPGQAMPGGDVIRRTLGDGTGYAADQYRKWLLSDNGQSAMRRHAYESYRAPDPQNPDPNAPKYVANPYKPAQAPSFLSEFTGLHH